MLSFVVTCLVEFTDKEHEHWSESSDEIFGIARKLNAQKDGVLILDINFVPNNTLPKYEVLTKEGGV